MPEEIDRRAVIALNSFLGSHSGFDKTIELLGQNGLIRGFPVFFPLVALWFYRNDLKTRGRLVAGLMACFLAVFLTSILQRQFFVHTRPILDETLHLWIYDPKITAGWDRLSSFPSDTAALFFSLCAVIFLESPLIGSLAFVWSFFSVGVLRVMTGYHYPSDIIGSFVLAIVCVFLIGRSRYIIALCERLLAQFQSAEYLIHATFFIIVGEAYENFPGLQDLFKQLWALAREFRR
jgi:membrane-associated phospholipid phosphatase